MRRTAVIVGCVLLIGAVVPDVHAQNYFCACTIGKTPVTDNGYTVYTYEIESLVELEATSPGFLIEVTDRLINHTDLPEVLHFDISESALLMQCRFLQAVGLASIAAEPDFHPLVVRDLVAFPLLEYDGKTYSLYVNTLNPNGERLIPFAEESLEDLIESGELDRIKRSHGLE